MDSCLQHHGIKGMRWGIRRFQNKDGSLTPLGRKRDKQKEETKEETVEERRARVLKSTDARELHKNKDILTTAEINERLNRIDTEARLARVAESTKSSGMERVDKAIKVARKANEIYELTNSPLGKMVKKTLGKKVESGLSPDLKKVWENRDQLSDEQLTKVLKRATTEKTIKKMVDEYEEGMKSTNSDSGTKKSDDTKTFTGTVEGTGTSQYSGRKSGPTVDAEEGRDFRNVNSSDVSSGKSYVAGFLEDKRRGK